MTSKFNTTDETEFAKVAEYLVTKINSNTTISLVGDLGAGKTTLIKYLAKALGIQDLITSPTFNIIKEYDNRFCHIDAYRVNQEDIGIDHYLDLGYIICIEWAENISDYIDEFDLTIYINYTETGREIIIVE